MEKLTIHYTDKYNDAKTIEIEPVGFMKLEIQTDDGQHMNHLIALINILRLLNRKSESDDVRNNCQKEQ